MHNNFKGHAASSNGFSLVEVLLVSSLVTMMLLGINKLILTSMQGTRQIESKTEFNSLIQNLELVLKDEKICSGILFNQRKDPKLMRPLFNPDLKSIKAEDVLSVIQSNQTLITAVGKTNQLFTVTRLELEEIDPKLRVKLDDTRTRYFSKLHLEAKKSGTLSRQGLLTHDFIVWLTTNSDRIESCVMDSPRSISSETSESALVNIGLAAGRISIKSDDPVPLSGESASAVIYFVPFRGNQVPLFDTNTGKWSAFLIPSAGVQGSPDYASPNTNYDVFAIGDSSKRITLLSLVKWKNNQARQYELFTQDGVLVRREDKSQRYLGTVRTNTKTKFEDSEARRFIWNFNNRVKRVLKVTDPAIKWNYTTYAWRPANNNLNNRVEIVTGFNDSYVDITLTTIVSNMGGYGIYVYAGICEDCTTGAHGQMAYFVALEGFASRITGWLAKTPTIGYHFYQWTETVVTTYSYPDIYGSYNGGLNGSIEN